MAHNTRINHSPPPAEIIETKERTKFYGLLEICLVEYLHNFVKKINKKEYLHNNPYPLFLG